MSTPLIRDIESEQAGGEPSVINELGVDPTTDPELYMALQLSLQEERSRQAALAARQVRALSECCMVGSFTILIGLHQGSATGSEAGQSGTGTVVEAIPCKIHLVSLSLIIILYYSVVFDGTNK